MTYFSVAGTGTQKTPNTDRAKRRHRLRAKIAERDAAKATEDARRPKPPESVTTLLSIKTKTVITDPEVLKTKPCSICGKPFFKDFGNEAWPVNNGECCAHCNDTVVIPRRAAKDRRR